MIPVHSGFDETVTAIRRVLEAENSCGHEVVIIDDATPDPALARALDALPKSGLATMLRNERNLGFVATANRGMALHPDRDVVLLNADTEVFDGWLDRLRAHAADNVATVTPMSNAATILSYPVALRDNHEPLELDDRALDRLAAKLGPWSCEIPTAIGFCMYVARRALQVVGPFDEATFGLGYGEENDFCRRAAKAGWRNLAAGDVFVRHHGGTSFGPEKVARVGAGIAAVERLHPGYRRLVAEFIRQDPLAPLRRRWDEAQVRSAAPGGRLVADPACAQQDKSAIRLEPTRSWWPRRYRLACGAAPLLPNLPDFDLADPTPVLAETLRHLGVISIDLGGSPPRRLSRRLADVGRESGIAIVQA